MSMIKYTGKILRSFSEKIVGIAASPAADHLFKIMDEKESTYLSEEQAQSFHHTTAQLLFMCIRYSRDIQTAVIFFTTIVKKPDENDWGKFEKGT